MLALPSLTMPSSSDQDSWWLSWKYRSAKSTAWVSTSPNTRSRRRSSSPLGRSIRSRANASGSATTVGFSASLMSVSRAQLRCECAVPECRKTLAHARLPGQIDVSDCAAAPARHALLYPSPVVDDHAVAIGLASARMEARLRRGYNITEVFDGARTQQRLPVC